MRPLNRESELLPSNGDSLRSHWSILCAPVSPLSKYRAESRSNARWRLFEQVFSHWSCCYVTCLFFMYCVLIFVYVDVTHGAAVMQATFQTWSLNYYRIQQRSNLYLTILCIHIVFSKQVVIFHLGITVLGIYCDEVHTDLSSRGLFVLLHAALSAPSPAVSL